MTTYCIQNTEVQYLQQQNQVPEILQKSFSMKNVYN